MIWNVSCEMTTPEEIGAREAQVMVNDALQAMVDRNRMDGIHDYQVRLVQVERQEP